MVGVALVLALVAGTLFALHTLGSSAPPGENGVVLLRPRRQTRPPPLTPRASLANARTNRHSHAHGDEHAGATPPPQLSVSPQQETGMCLLGRYADLTLENSGGSDLTWTATSSAANVKPDPASGTLAAGATQTVTLSGTHLGNTFTVTFSGNGGDATVTITCA